METKSVKMQWLDSGATLSYTDGDRFHKAWREFETGTYHYQAGYEGLGVDWRAEFDTLEELRSEMGDLRHWSQSE